MSNDGVLSEFDPLAASKQSNSMTTQTASPSQGKEKETPSILDEFDPLTKQGKADKERVIHSVKQTSAAPVHAAQSGLVLSTSQSSGKTSPGKPTQPHTSNVSHRHVENSSSIKLQSVNKMDKSGIRKGGEASGVSRTAVSEVSKLDRIGAEISQIDSVLKALNMGQFHLSTMSSFTGSTPTPQTQGKPQPKQVCIDYSTRYNILISTITCRL